MCVCVYLQITDDHKNVFAIELPEDQVDEVSRSLFTHLTTLIQEREGYVEVCPSFYCFVLSLFVSLFLSLFLLMAGARAILLALECIEHSNKKRFLIFTDSMLCLQALDHLKTSHYRTNSKIQKLNSLTTSDFDIHLCWLPGHVSIPGNK